MEALLKKEQKKAFDSICNATMVGFVQDRNHSGSMEKHRVQCFYGEALPNKDDSASLAQSEDVIHLAQTKAKREVLPKQGNLFEQHVPSDASDMLIEYINKDDKLPWKANTCMLQKSHPSYQCDSHGE